MLARLSDRDDLLHVEQALLAASICGAKALLRQAHALLPQRLAVVSSFGAESAVLLSLVAEVDPDLPVIFLQTGMHFPETLDYRLELEAALGLTRVIDASQGEAALHAADPGGRLWHFDPDACCALRKVAPLDRALDTYDGWVSGRKRYQSAARNHLPSVERDGSRLKINPLADWDARRIEEEMARRQLPRHPLVAEGYSSIGCGPCTRRAEPGAHPRSGRWAGTNKVECGIHRHVEL